MGIIDPNKHDAFLSYARLDNEDRNGLIERIRDKLEKKIKSRIIKKRYDLKGREVSIFRDKDNLEKSGEIADQLAPHVRNSWFLFVFMSEHYLNSSWCDKELDWFKENFRGETTEALKHTIIVVLEKGALSSGWKSYLSGEDRPLYIEFFDKSGETHDFYSNVISEVGMDINPAVDNTLDQIAAHITEMALREQLIPPKRSVPEPRPIPPLSVVSPPTPGLADNSQKPLQKPSSTTEKPRIAIGLVTPDLEDVRNRLREALEAEGNIEVQALDLEDFKKLEDVEMRVERAALFIQPYSYHPVEFDYFNMPDGGHLEFQESLVKNIQKSLQEQGEAKPIPIWHWYPEGQPGGIEPGGRQDLDKENRHFAYIEGLRKRAKTERPEDMAKEIMKFLGLCRDSRSPYQLPTVMIESTPEDQERSERIAQAIAGLWTSHDEFKECGPLLTYPLEWNMLDEFTAYLRNCDGFVFVYGSKQYGSLFHQVQRLDSNLKLIGWEPGRAVIAVPPEKKAKDQKGFWNMVRFYENGQLHEDDERAALRFLGRVKQAWKTKNQVQVSAA